MSSTENNNVKNSQIRGYERGSSKFQNGETKFDYIVDFRSDTVTRPSQEMRQKMANAVVGDDVMGEDPTVKELEERMSKLLNKEAGLYVPSGSMANLISVLTHCNTRGAEAIIGDSAHMFLYEQGSMAQFGGVQANTIQNEPNGTFSIQQVIKNIRPWQDPHFAKTSVICVENTHNMCGGRIIPLEWIDELAKVGRAHNIPLHMDGARLFNASVGSGISPQRIVQDFSSVSICLSKGLGAPIGSVLCGSNDFIKMARRTRKALGGGMRQVGIIAAAGLYCLDHMIDRLVDDHNNAKLIAKSLDSLKSKSILSVDYDAVETNIFMLNIKSDSQYTADDVCARLEAVTSQEKIDLGEAISVLAIPKSGSVLRLVTHCDISREMAEKAANKICYVSKELATA